MRKASVFMQNELAGFLIESTDRSTYTFEYVENYDGLPVSLTMPVHQKFFSFPHFPPFFDGVLPEGIMLEGLLRQLKIDKKDYFSQLLAVGEDLVGAVTVKPLQDE
ncbi:MAG: HipA N-terminal domain-containing protein [Bacteroidota bacterium]